jgi:hypothetical protein
MCFGKYDLVGMGLISGLRYKYLVKVEEWANTKAKVKFIAKIGTNMRTPYAFSTSETLQNDLSDAISS